MELRTGRLVLREPREDDLDAALALLGDPEGARYFPSVFDRDESATHLARARAHWAEHGFGKFAVELPGEATFIGLVGLTRVTFDASFSPAVEIGWRITRPFWRRGIAREAAEAVLADGFERLGLAEIVAFTVPTNTPSRAVMRSLGMVHDAAGDFDHPHISEGHPLRRHVLYRLDAGDRT